MASYDEETYYLPTLYYSDANNSCYALPSTGSWPRGRMNGYVPPPKPTSHVPHPTSYKNLLAIFKHDDNSSTSVGSVGPECRRASDDMGLPQAMPPPYSSEDISAAATNVPTRENERLSTSQRPIRLSGRMSGYKPPRSKSKRSGEKGTRNGGLGKLLFG